MVWSGGVVISSRRGLGSCSPTIPNVLGGVAQLFANWGVAALTASEGLSCIDPSLLFLMEQRRGMGDEEEGANRIGLGGFGVSSKKKEGAAV